MDWVHEEPLHRLRDLLGPKPTHPWAALLPQLLLWCFRRFCIQKLMEASSTPLMEQVWDTQHELVSLYAPKGLTGVGETWLTPENIERIHSSLEDYQIFFLDFLDLIDTSIQKENDVLQNYVSEFLDVQIRDTILEWLSPSFRRFLIYPLKESQEDEFTDSQFMALIQVLLQYSRDAKMAEARRKAEEARAAAALTEEKAAAAAAEKAAAAAAAVAVAEKAAAAVEKAAAVAEIPLPEPAVATVAAAEPEPPVLQPQQPPQPQQPQQPPQPPQQPPPPSQAIAKALHRRRTLRAARTTPSRVRTHRKPIPSSGKEAPPPATKE